MLKSVLKALLLLIFYINRAYSTWEFAITTKSKIIFYDNHWQEIISSAHQFDQLSALTFDETEEILYFNDRLHNNGSVFSLKLASIKKNSELIDNVIQRTINESITSIAYDPLDRNLYWADNNHRKIYFTSLDASKSSLPKVFLDFANENTIPDGITIDICRRELYFTNSNFKNATVEKIKLNGTDRRVLISSGLYLPHGIIIDQFVNRIYWVNDQQGIHFSIESSNLDGSDHVVVFKGSNNLPLNIVVSKDAIFWTDLTYNAVWTHTKYNNITKNIDFNSMSTVSAFEEDPQSLVNNQEESAHKVLGIVEQPRGIVVRTRFLANLERNQYCSDVIKTIKSRLLTPKTESQSDEQITSEHCLNNGEYSPKSDVCICKIGYSGIRCEINECQNYCVHGTCSISSMGFPTCTCKKGFYGQRCQSYKCTMYCMNDGRCTIADNGEPECNCKENFDGQRCEKNATETCALHCRILKHEPESNAPFGCHDICEELMRADESYSYERPIYQDSKVCNKTVVAWNNNAIIIVAIGIVTSLALIAVIVHGFRRFFKPARPRIKKTFIVRKQASSSTSTDTPLTNRPIATEQCEITIENCCNMNICDTPCFDPQLVQKPLTGRNALVKEDKKMLIPNMEDDTY